MVFVFLFPTYCTQYVISSCIRVAANGILLFSFMVSSIPLSFPHGSSGPHARQESQETWVRSLGWEDPLEEEMETHSIILAWRIPRTEEPGGLQS